MPGGAAGGTAGGLLFVGSSSQERKGHINLRKIPGTPSGCPWDIRRDKQGSTGRCPRDFLLFTIEKRTEKGIFAGTPAGCPRDTRPSRGFSEILCDFFLCAFSAPYQGKGSLPGSSLWLVSPVSNVMRQGSCCTYGAIGGSNLAVCQKRPFVHNSVYSQFWESLFAILAECSQVCLRSL